MHQHKRLARQSEAVMAGFTPAKRPTDLASSCSLRSFAEASLQSRRVNFSFASGNPAGCPLRVDYSDVDGDQCCAHMPFRRELHFSALAETATTPLDQREVAMKKKLSPIALGAAIRVARERARMSANDLARQVGMTASSLSRTETGYRAVELAEAVQIADAIGITVADLIAIAGSSDLAEHLQRREQAMADLERSKASIKEMADVVLQELKRQLPERL